MTILARAIIRASALIVPTHGRHDWSERWLAELEALISESGDRGAGLEAIRFALGAPRHAAIEAFDEWTAHGLVRDAYLALRRLAHQPGVALTCIGLIGIAVAANAAIFSVVNATMLRTPPAILDGDRLVQIGRAKTNGAFDMFSFPVFEQVRAAAPAIESTAAYSDDRFVVDEGRGARLAAGQLVTAGYFAVLRAWPSPGREFTREEERGGIAVAVIGYDLWRRNFSGDPAAIGAVLVIDGVRTRIVGVAPAGFVGADIGTATPEFWLPIGFGGDEARGRLEDRRRSWVWTVGRLRDGASIEQARAQLAPMQEAIERAHPGTMGVAIAVTPGVGLHPDDREEARTVMRLMAASVAVVLVIACANVASLLLARAIERRRELALRLALGASRFRIVRESVIESVVLALCAGAAGAAASRWASLGVRRLMPYELAVDFQPDMRVFAFTFGCAALTGVVIGLLPARQAARTDLMAVIREDPVGKASGRARATLIVLQLALSFVLVSSSAILVRSLVNAATVRPGFDPDHVLATTLGLQHAGWEDEPAAALSNALSARIRQLPGVAGVGLARRLPVADALPRRSVALPENSLDATEEPAVSPWTAVDAAYFATMGIPIVRGRGFDGGDRRGSEKVVIVSESLARRLWGEADPIDRQLRAAMDRVRVVGVARDTAAMSLRDRAMWLVYAPLAQQRAGDLTLVVRATPGLAVESLASPVGAAIAALAPGVPIVRTASLRALVTASLGETRLTATLLALYGGVAFLVSCIGLYALQLHATRQRRREFGIRLALGASRLTLHRLVVSGALRLTAMGVAAGFCAAVPAGRALERLMFGVRAADPASLTAAALLFLMCGIAAAAGPARDAGAVDPIASLRHD